MFYHPLLLHHQHKMQLIKPWLAATRGVTKIKKLNIIECDTFKICDFIMQFLRSESRDPKKRLSLRLSTMLVHGTVLIWRQQVIFLTEEIDRYIKDHEYQVKRLTELLSDERQISKSVLEKKKPKKRKSIVETPESLLLRDRDQPEEDFLRPIRLPEIFQEPAILPARMDEITLREDAPFAREALGEDFGESFPAMPEIPQPPPAQMIVQAAVHVSAEPLAELERAIPQVEEIIIPEEAPAISVPAAKDQVEELVEKPEEIAKAVEEITTEEIQKEKRKRPSKEKIAEEQIVEKKKEAAADEWKEIIEVPQEIRPKVAKKRGKVILKKPRKERFRPISQKLKIFSDVEVYTAIREQKLPDFVPMKKLWPSWVSAIEDHAEVDIVRAERRTQTLSSVGAVELTGGTPSVSSLVQLTPQEVPSLRPKHVSTPTKRGLSRDETITEVMPPAANGIHLISPAKKRKIISVEEAEVLRPLPQELEKLAEPIEEQVEVEPSIQVQAPELQIPLDEMEQEPILPRLEEDYLGIKWSTRIMRIINAHVRITPVNICEQLQERVTKLNMARIFNSLLALERNEYVLMHAAENSSELEVVEKGAKEFF